MSDWQAPLLGRYGQYGAVALSGPQPLTISRGDTSRYREAPMAISLKIDDELKGRVQQLATLRDRSPHWIMREAIKQYVEHEEARESFRQEAMASWTAYRETGRHLSGDEIAAWLGGWGTDAEAELPECRD